jgi:hypothetical protein
MADAPKDDNEIDEAKLDRVLKKLLSTPPKPHKAKDAVASKPVPKNRRKASPSPQ